MRDKIQRAFQKGLLKTRSVSPQGDIEWQPILFVLRHEDTEEHVIEVTTSSGTFKATENHKIFITPTEKKSAGSLEFTNTLLGIQKEQISHPEVLSIRKTPPRKYVYDLTVDKHHNFQLYNSGVVVSNSPDRHYHFRPPEHEGVIQNYNRVFGQIWEDYELLEYLKLGLAWWNMYPPETEYLCSLESLMQLKPTWKTAVLWAAMVHALTALAINWISEEFSIAGNEMLTVRLESGEDVEVSIGELHEILKGS